jgi:hypothetical protein
LLLSPCNLDLLFEGRSVLSPFLQVQALNMRWVRHG